MNETPALTPAEATAVVNNGGLLANKKNVWWHDGVFFRSSGGGSISVCPYVTDRFPHPLYDPAIFAREYPCTLPGPEAKALLMAAPGGMLWGCREHNCDEFEKFADYWTGEEFTGELRVRWSWSKHHIYQVRIRPNWLENQRERFAQGRFGEQQQTKEPTMPTPTIYLPDSPPVTFPWQGTGAECVRIWNAAPEGMLEWSISKIMWGSKPLKGDTNATYHLRPRADYRAPQPGDVVDAAEAWKLVWQGWVEEDCEGGTASGFYVLRHGDGVFMVDGSLDADECPAKFHERLQDVPYTLLRHEPWRCASLATGYVWDGKQAEQALRAGMEGKPEITASVDGKWYRAHGERVLHVVDPDPSSCYTLAGVASNDTNWALRWPAKEANMETKDETLCGWAALDALRAGDVLQHDCENLIRIMNGNLYYLNAGEWKESSNQLNSLLNRPFTRVPAKPTSKTITLDNGMEVVVYADRVEADVPRCGKWLSTRERYETALKCEGLENVFIERFAAHATDTLKHGYVKHGGVVIDGKLVTFSDIRRVLSAMQEVEG